MIYVSYTHFRTQGFWGTLLFQWHVLRSRQQARQSIGLRGMELWHSGGTNFHTLSIWETKEAMLHFRNHGAHRLAMQLSARMGEGHTVGWYSADEPTRSEAEDRLADKLNAIGKLDWLDERLFLRA